MEFKVKCVSTGFTPHFTVGKIYDVDGSGLSCNVSGKYTFWMRGDGKNDFTKLKEWFNDFDDNTRFELVDNQKIVITTDGKTTTATLYREDGSKEVATAKCCPEDTFDFNVGAKLAMERLMKKVAPVEEWRVVDRKPRPGDYIRITNPEYSFDNKGDIRKIDGVRDYDFVYIYQKNHPTSESSKNPNFDWSYPKRMWELVEKVTTTEPKKPEFGNVKFKTGDYAKIIAKKWGHNFEIGTIVKLERCEYNYRATADGKSWKVMDDELEAYTPPKYFTGKVVCIENSINDGEFTVGKIYEIKDGNFTDNFGEIRPKTGGRDRVKTLSDLENEYYSNWHYKFIPIVE